MNLLSSGTHPKIKSLQIQFWRQASQAELRRRLASLLLGEELARKAYGELDDTK